jgi:hypothetical protein
LSWPWDINAFAPAAARPAVKPLAPGAGGRCDREPLDCVVGHFVTVDAYMASFALRRIDDRARPAVIAVVGDPRRWRAAGYAFEAGRSCPDSR